MEIFNYNSYRIYVQDRVKAMPKNGHGQFMKIAKHIGANPVVVTQVLKGSREFSEEQALRLTNYLGLNALESEYFMRLTALERAGTHDLKQFHKEALNQLRRQAQSAKGKSQAAHEIDEPTKSIFYSDWIYSGIRLLSSIEAFSNIDAIAERLKIPRARVAEIVEFLVRAGLSRYNDKGELDLGVVSTHVDAQSRFVNNHRRNWRLKGLEALNKSTQEELFYSGPCALSENVFQELRAELLEIVASLTRKAPREEPQVLACLNIDWFKV